MGVLFFASATGCTGDHMNGMWAAPWIAWLGAHERSRCTLIPNEIRTTHLSRSFFFLILLSFQVRQSLPQQLDLAANLVKNNEI